MHGSLNNEFKDDVYEEQDLVIKHKDMTIKEWVKIRSFASKLNFTTTTKCSKYQFYYYVKFIKLVFLT